MKTGRTMTMPLSSRTVLTAAPSQAADHAALA